MHEAQKQLMVDIGREQLELFHRLLCLRLRPLARSDSEQMGAP